MKNVKGFKLNVTREFGSWRGEDASLGFVIACIATGQPPKYLELHEQALVIAGASANFTRPQKWLRCPLKQLR